LEEIEVRHVSCYVSCVCVIDCLQGAVTAAAAATVAGEGLDEGIIAPQAAANALRRKHKHRATTIL
jgi:hypothetical protein